MLAPADLTRLATDLGGLPILGCLAGSPAGNAGLCYGDIILSINGLSTGSWSDFFQARRQITGQISVRVFRQGVEFDAALELPVTADSPREVLGAATQRTVSVALQLASDTPEIFS